MSDELRPTNQRVTLAGLKPHPRNYNRHPASQIERIATSLRKFGQVRSVVVHRGYILAGHGVVEAARSLGWRELAADVLPDEYPEHLALAYVAADNELGRLADPDQAALAAILEESRAVDAELMAAIGYSDAEFRALLDEVSRGERAVTQDTEPQIDRAEELRQKWGVEPGQLWQLGEHRLICGDCTDAATVARVMGGERADMVCTDPPYAIYGSSTGIGGDVTDDNMVRPFMRVVLATFTQVTNLGAHIYTFCDWRSYAAWWDEAKKQNLVIRNCIVWDKGDGGLGSNYTMRHEFVIFYEHLTKAVTMNAAARGRSARTVNGRANVQRFNVPQNDERFHNAAKPVELLKVLIEASSDIGGTVFDPFSGSGTTLIACENLGRRCRAVEIAPGYVAVALERFYQHSGKVPVLVSGE